MNFASRITRSPIAYDPDRAAEIAASFAAPPEIMSVLSGTAGSSPYLHTLLVKEADWIIPALDDPEAAMERLFAELDKVAPDQIAVALRQGKRRVALLTGLADLAGVWPLETVTRYLTRYADLSAFLALRAEIGHEIRRGKLPGATEDDAQIAGGMVALAMGKQGAYELNYSSDIDLICLFDESRFDHSDYQEARASFVRATKKMASMLNDLTGDGYVFRTDLRLRPDPAVTPVCMAMAAAETYYESLGRTWERAAYIKARAAIGDIKAGEAFLKTLTPFVWRKHLDFAAIQDAHDMRLKIREHKGFHGPINLYGHNMKLGKGGIREIEFFTQTRQLIAGGRDTDLRVRGTVEGLAVLAAKGWIGADAAETLTKHYRAHREVEHRLQMINDAQTHSLPTSDDAMDRVAALMGISADQMKADIKARLEEVHEVTEGFFAPDAADPRAIVEENTEVTSRWRSYAALRSGRAVEIFNRLKPEILRKLQDTAKPEEALLAFDGFLEGLPAGVQLFSLFEANPQLIDLLVDIVGNAPALGRYLSRNAKVFDAVIGGDFFRDWPTEDALVDDLTKRLSTDTDYERKLDEARRWGKEWHFRIGVHLLRGLIDADTAGRQYADLAGAMLRGLWPQVVAEFAAKHGELPGRGAVVLGMGSLGASRLSATSDLDVIVIYDPLDVEMSDGRRPLNVRTFYSRLTQSMVTAMTAPMSEGRLYEVDMRLRPSGNKGPVATSLNSFISYQREEAWVWEHLALTRARIVAGDSELARDVEAFRVSLLGQADRRDEILREVAIMRGRIAAAKTPDSLWDMKIGAGRMQDIELVAQAGALIAGSPSRRVLDGLDAAVTSGWMSQDQAGVLGAVYQLASAIQIVSKLLTEGALDPNSLGAGGAALLLQVTGEETLDLLHTRLVENFEAAAEIIGMLLPQVEAA